MNYQNEKIIRKYLVEADELGSSIIEHDGQDAFGEYGRTVEISPSWSRDSIDDRDLSDRFDLHFTDRHFDLSQTIEGGNINELKASAAVQVIAIFLTGHCLEDTEDYFDQFINQADRECYVVEGSVTATRLRISYDMPASGRTEAWRHHVSFTTYRTHDEIANRTRRRERRPDEHIQTTRYIARLA